MDGEVEITKEQAKYFRDEFVLTSHENSLGKFVQHKATKEDKDTAVKLQGVSPENFDKIIGKPEEKQQRVVVMSKFSPVPYGKKMMDDHRFLLDNSRRFWRYDKQEGIWKEDAEYFIKHLLTTSEIIGDEQQTRNYIEEITDYIRRKSWSEKDVSNPPTNLIAFKNVLYDLDKEEFLEFSPDYFITVKIPVALDYRYKDCLAVDQFFEDLVGKDNISVLMELCAYCLLRSYPYQKFFILYGKGKNGKSAFLKLLTAFLGLSNISSETPHSLVNNRFARGNLWNKLANISSDIPYIALQDTNSIKELTGEDYINCERKYRDSFRFKNYAKLIFSGNELPQINDKTFAFYRRVYIIPFNQQINKADPFIVDKVAREDQLSGLAWRLVKLLKEMRKRDFAFEVDPDVKDMEQLYEDLSNPLNRFLREMTVSDKDSSVFKYEFKDRFLDWLNQNGFRLWKDHEVNQKMSEKYNEVRKLAEGYDNGKLVQKAYRAWEGVKWK